MNEELEKLVLNINKRDRYAYQMICDILKFRFPDSITTDGCFDFDEICMLYLNGQISHNVLSYIEVLYFKKFY